MHIGTAAERHLGDDIDGSYQRGSAKDPSCRSFQHLNTFNVMDINREIKSVMSRLRIADIDAVEQNSDLLGCAAPYADVSLRTQWSPLSDIHASDEFQQIVHTLYWRLRNLLTVQYRYHSRCLSDGKRSARARDFHAIEHHLPIDLPGGGIHLVGIRTHTVSLRISERRHAEYTDKYHLSQTSKECIALVAELLELQGYALVVFFIVLHSSYNQTYLHPHSHQLSW